MNTSPPLKDPLPHDSITLTPSLSTEEKRVLQNEDSNDVPPPLPPPLLDHHHHRCLRRGGGEGLAWLLGGPAHQLHLGDRK